MTREEMILQAEKMRQRGFPPMAEKPEDLPVQEELFYIPSVQGRQVPVYAYRPQKGLPAGCPMLVNFHGGGFVKGRADRDGVYCKWLAHTLDALVWDVDYALAPENPFPAAMEDSWAAAAYAFANAGRLGVDEKRIALLGHSAGGSLVADLCMLAVQRGGVKPAAVLMEYFPADMQADPVEKLTEEQKADEKEMRRAEVGRLYNLFYCDAAQTADPLVSPLMASEEQLAAFPPALVLSAGLDKLREEDEQFALRLGAAGVPVTFRRFASSQHGFTINRGGQWREALELHQQYLRAVLHIQPKQEDETL